MVSSNPLKIYTSTSFVGDLSYEAPIEQVAGMAHTFVTGRKTWKTLKHKKEAVWPAYIEAALFHALELYRPSSSADPRSLRRFPKRNRFISDHIFKVTGKMRTPKQVGSRLQQLRDTCQEDKVLKLLSRRDFPPARPGRSSTRSRSRSPASTSSSPTSSVATLSLPSSASTSPATSPVTAEFPDLFTRCLNLHAPQPVNGPLPRPALNTTPPVVYLNFSTTMPPLVASRGTRTVVEPEPLVTFNLYGISSPVPPSAHHVTLYPLGEVPTIKFFSDVDISSTHQSMFYVFYDDELLYSEDIPIDASLSNGMVTFSTQMIPKSWGSFCQLNDIHRYTIAQDVMKTSSIGENETIQDLILFSVTYKFQTWFNAHPLAQFSPTIDFSTGNAVQASATPLLHAPRPLLLDTANTVMSMAPLHPERLWFDHCGDVITAPHTESSYDFTSVSDVDPSNYCRIEQPLEDSYLNFPSWDETPL